MKVKLTDQSGIGKIGYNSTINEAELDRFKSQWPAHGLPDNLASLGFSFDSKGDLNDIDARTHEGKSLDSSDFDGPALVALSEDAQRKVNPGHADDRFGKRGTKLCPAARLAQNACGLATPAKQ